MDVTINAVDANGLPIAGASCAVAGGATATTDPTGSASLSVGGGAVSISVAHPAFVHEDVAFTDVLYGTWNNSLVAKVATSANAVQLRVTLGRCAVAPTVQISEERARDLARTRTDPGGVLLFQPPLFPTQWAYRFHWDDPMKIRVAQSRLLPTTTPGAAAHGWDRFAAVTSDPVPIADRGRFFWLVYPQSGPSPFVVAIWSPSLAPKTPVPALDYIVYLSPHTGSYTANYPYGLLSHGEDPVDQQYMSLGAKYLLKEYCFAYELAAAGNSAVLVMPICRKGDWGPFASGEGIHRLLREVSVFLHRELRTSSLGNDKPGYDPTYRLAGGSVRSGAGISDTYFGPVPPVGKVAIGFFSTGATPAKAAMKGYGLPHGLTAADWGTPTTSGTAPDRLWSAAWREVWDMDGFHPQTGGWPTYLELLKDWYKADRERQFHLCHSAGRLPPAPMSYPALLRERPGPLWTVPSTAGFGGAQEMHTDRWSVVTFADEYVSNGSVTVMPYLPDAHHATSMVAFSHDASMTNVGMRRALSFQRGP